ncbi:MAG: hypothetical protein ACK5C5_00070 [Bacteroidota bacterium]|jgi:hypothetical protein
MRLILVTCLVALSCSSFAGNDGMVFPADTPLVGFKGKPKFFITLDNTGSFVDGKPAVTNEIRLGLDFKKKLKLGIGYGLLVSDIVIEKSVINERSGKDSIVPSKLSLDYFSANAEYVLYHSKRWQISSPLFVGLGSSYFQYYDLDSKGILKEKRTDEGTVLVTVVGAMGTYRFIRWLGVSAGLGYRVGILNNNKVEQSFNSPVYTFRFRIFFGEIYKTLFPRGINGKKDPPYSNEGWE